MSLFTRIDTIILRVKNMEQAKQWYVEKSRSTGRNTG